MGGSECSCLAPDWQEIVVYYMSMLNSLTDLTDEEKQLFCDYVCEVLEGDTPDWDYLENIPDGGNRHVYLSLDEARDLYLRHIAVRFVVDCLDWYPWKLWKDTESLLHFLSWEPDTPTYGFRHKAVLKFEATGGNKRKIPRPLANPLSAAYWARYELLGAPGAIPQGMEPLDALSEVVEWYHGPENALTSCSPIICASWCDPPGLPGADWTEQALAGYDLEQNPPFPIVGCSQDGSQAWIHSYIAYWNPVQTWYWNQIGQNLGITSGTFEFRSLVKQGGCGLSSDFFVAAAAGMNIPVLFDYTILANHWGCKSPVAYGSLQGTRFKLVAHVTIKIPKLGLALRHGDDLWGPGGSLFRGKKLFVPHDIALAAPYKYIQVKEKGGSVMFDSGNSGLAHSNIDLQTRMVLQTEAHADYWVSRKYWESMLEDAETEEYAQIALCAFLYGASEMASPTYNSCVQNAPANTSDETLGVFGMMRKWMHGQANPAYKYLGPDIAGHNAPFVPPQAVYPSLYRSDWGGQIPRTLWEEPWIQSRIAALVKTFGLDQTSYNVPMGDPGNLLFKNISSPL